jgi:hypothetical protein
MAISCSTRAWSQSTDTQELNKKEFLLGERLSSSHLACVSEEHHGHSFCAREDLSVWHSLGVRVDGKVNEANCSHS